MAFTGAIQVVVTGGVPAATMQGTTLQDGTYTITVGQDDSGFSVDVATPYGDVGQVGIQRGDATE
jgi:hypothetical protein